ncbi:hypothetical protein TNCT_163611, partial [Trichonephila clavata]
ENFASEEQENLDDCRNHSCSLILPPKATITALVGNRRI